MKFGQLLFLWNLPEEINNIFKDKIKDLNWAI